MTSWAVSDRKQPSNVTVWLQRTQLDELDRRCKDLKKTKAEVVRGLIEKYLAETVS